MYLKKKLPPKFIFKEFKEKYLVTQIKELCPKNLEEEKNAAKQRVFLSLAISGH